MIRIAGKIKGITIEIAGETTKLQSALKDVNKKSKDLTSELKQVERGLRFNPKDTELLAQKQKLLGDQVANTREKLDKLKDAEKQVQQQFERGEIGEEQYRAFKREIIETESKLKHYENQLKAVTKEQNTFGEALQDAGKKMQDIGKKMQGVGKSLSMKVTAPLVGVAAAAGKLGMDFEAAMSEVGAISGATGRDLEALEAKAKEMGATTKFSASQSAEGLKYMAMAGWDTQKMLEGLPGVLSLAAASGEELGTVSDIVTDAMTAFGMEASQAGEFADILAAASSNANTNVGMLGESFKYVAPVAGALGYEADETAIALGLMANAGIKASQAGTAMRSILTRLAKPTKESGTAMDTLGISLTDSEGKMKSFATIMDDLRTAMRGMNEDQQAMIAAQLGGQQAMSGLLAIVNASEEDFNKLSDAIYNSTGAAEGMSKEMQDNLQGRLTILKSSLEGVALQLYDALQPAFEKIVGVIQKAVSWFANLSPEMQKVIVIIGGLAAALGPVLLILGTLISTVGTIIGLLPVLGTAFTVLTGPVGLIVAAIAAAIAIGVLLWKNWDKIKSKATEIWDAIKNFFAETWASIKAKIEEVWGIIATWLSEKWNWIKTTADTAWQAIKDFIQTPIQTVADWLQSTWESVANIIGDIWDGIKTAAQDKWESVATVIKGAINGIIGMINKFIRFWNSIELKVPSVNIPLVGTVGGFTVGVPNIPEIPMLAQGGIITQQTLAMLAEGNRPEAVMPLDKIDSIIAKALEKASGGGDTYIYVNNPQPSPAELARQIKRQQQELALGF